MPTLLRKIPTIVWTHLDKSIRAVCDLYEVNMRQALPLCRRRTGTDSVFLGDLSGFVGLGFFTVFL
jgi:hypothetical protein